MSKYNVVFKIERVDDDNSFITHGVGSFDVVRLPLENVEKLLSTLIEHARDLENAVEPGTAGKMVEAEDV